MIAAAVLFLGLATVAAQAVILALLALLVGARVSRTLERPAAALREAIGPQAVALAGVVALLATAGSLFLSDVAAFAPCTLCWYERIAMFPLVVVLGVAILRDESDVVRPYAWPLVVLGAAVAAYHYVIQLAPSLETTACRSDVPCTMSEVWQFGYVSIPLMALTAFALIGVLLGLAGRRGETVDESEQESI